MFKLIALVGAVAGGATYGYYQYGYNGCDGGSCSLSRKSCCVDAPPPSESDCCANTEACCTTGEACCAEKVAAKTPACCAESATRETGFFTSAKAKQNVAQKAALCCANPCLGCLLTACEGCADCTECCGGEKAKPAVVKPAAAAGVQ